MSNTRQLRDTWIASMRKMGPGVGYRHPDGFRKLLDGAADTIITHIREEMELAGLAAAQADEIIESYRARRAEFFQNDGPIGQLMQDYSNLYIRCVSLLSERRQQNWATTWDYVKMYFSRTLQTVTIAAIILATGYTAKIWEIPLPLLRMVPQ